MPRSGLHPERPGESATLRLDQLVGDLLEHGVEQVRHGAEWDGHLCLGAPRDKDANPLALRGRHALSPEDRLTDAGLAANEQRGRPIRKPGGKVGQPGQLPAPPDELEARRYGHARTVGLLP